MLGARVSKAAAQPFNLFTLARCVALGRAAHAGGAHVAAQVFVGLVLRGFGTGDEDETALTAVFLVELENRLGQRARPGKKIQHQVTGLGGQTQDAVHQLQGLGRREHIVVALLGQYLVELLLRVLRVSHGVVTPQGLRYHTLLDFREEALQRWNVASVFAPPHPIVRIQLVKLAPGNAPIRARRRPINHPPRRTSDGVAALAVVVPCGKVAGLPWAARVVVSVLVCLVLFCRTRQRIGPPDIAVGGIDQHVLVVVREVNGGVFGGIDLLPDDVSDVVVLAKHLVHQQAQIEQFVVVNRDKNHAILGQQVFGQP